MADVHDVKEATLSAERLETAAKDNVYLEDDPHRAALEDNPDKSAPVQWSTMLAVFVRIHSILTVLQSKLCVDG